MAKNIKDLAQEIKKSPIKVMAIGEKEKPEVFDIKEFRGFPRELLPAKDPMHLTEKEIPVTKFEEEPGGKEKKPEYPKSFEDLSEASKVAYEKVKQLMKKKDDMIVLVATERKKFEDSIKNMETEKVKAIQEYENSIQGLAQQIASEHDKMGAICLRAEEHLIWLIRGYKEVQTGKATDKWRIEKILDLVKSLGWDADLLIKKLEDAEKGLIRYRTEKINEIHRQFEPEYKKKNRSSIKTADMWSAIKEFFATIFKLFKPVMDGFDSFDRKILQLDKLVIGSKELLSRPL